MMIQTLCYRLETRFDQFVPMIGPYLLHSLKNIKTLQQAVNTISQLCTYVESSQILSGFKDYVPLLFEHLNDDKIEIEVRKQVFGTIVDTYSIVKGEFSPYFDQL